MRVAVRASFEWLEALIRHAIFCRLAAYRCSAWTALRAFRLEGWRPLYPTPTGQPNCVHVHAGSLFLSVHGRRAVCVSPARALSLLGGGPPERAVRVQQRHCLPHRSGRTCLAVPSAARARARECSKPFTVSSCILTSTRGHHVSSPTIQPG